MKKILFIIVCTFISTSVYASSINDIAKIEYKWYKENITDLYYPKQSILEGYTEDDTKIEYGPYSYWASGFCNYSQDQYDIESKKTKIYDKIINTKYITLEVSEDNICNNCQYFNEIKIYSNVTSLNYQIIKNDRTGLKISLPTWYEVDTLWFYIDSNVSYKIILTYDEPLQTTSLAYNVNHLQLGKVLIPDKNWIINKSVYTKRFEEGNVNTSPFIKNLVEEKLCRYREIMTYRYKIEREYYDQNYHTYIEGYIPDINDYMISYKDKTYSNTKIIEKVEKEYIPIEKVKEVLKTNDIIIPKIEEEVIYKDRYIDKIVYRIPKKFLLILLLLIIIIIILTAKILSKKVE